MAEIVNLRMARKRRDRAGADKVAAENRARSGRSGGEKRADAAARKRAERTLSAHLRDRPDEDETE